MIAPHQDNKILHRVQSSGYWLLYTWLLSLWWSSERNFPGWHWRLNWHAYVIYNPCFTCHMCASELTIQGRALTKFFFPPTGLWCLSEVRPNLVIFWLWTFYIAHPFQHQQSSVSMFYVCLCSLLTPGSGSPDCWEDLGFIPRQESRASDCRIKYFLLF